MRIIAAAVVFIGGLALLGLWAGKVTSVLIERDLRDRAQAALSEASHPIGLQVSGRDLHLTGLVESAGEGAYLRGLMDRVAGVRLVKSELTVLPQAKPYRIKLHKDAPLMPLQVSGHIPNEAMIQALALKGQEITLASGAPAQWQEMIKAAMSGLSLLDQGVAELEDEKLTLKGQIATAADEKLLGLIFADLKGVESHLAVELSDDGRPPFWRLDYDAEEGGEISGKLPHGVTPLALAELLGLGTLSGHPAVTKNGQDISQNFQKLSALAPWMGQLERLRLQWSDLSPRAIVDVQGGLEEKALSESLIAAGFSPQINRIEPSGENLSRRKNAASGRWQRLLGSYWLDEPDVIRTAQGCQAALDGAWQARDLLYEDKTARLTDESTVLINDLARHMVACAELPALQAEILYSSNETQDWALAQKRAEALLAQLQARGLREGALRLRAYGATGSDADIKEVSDASSGRAISILWIE